MAPAATRASARLVVTGLPPRHAGFRPLRAKRFEGFGSVLQVANVFRIYVSLVDTKERNDLAEWILANIVNEYAQYGTNNHGARSLAELKEKEKASFVLKRFTVTREGPPIQTSYTRRIRRVSESSQCEIDNLRTKGANTRNSTHLLGERV